MIQAMNVSTYLRRYGPTLDELAKDAGLSHSYIRHLARPNQPRQAGEVAAVKIARALRRQAVRLTEDALAIERAVYGEE